MAGIDEKFIEELKSKNNIVDVVGGYCALQRKGSVNYWACCPLPGHSEKTPSFTVNEIGQFYHCFGCGKGGDVIKFIQEVESVEFYDAVKMLAERVKMPIPTNDKYDEENARKNRERMDRLNSVMKDTALFYVRNLADKRAAPYIEYIKKRGISAATVRKFGMGVSVDYESLPKYLREKGYSDDEMLSAGVCSKSPKNGVIYDFEAERLIVPIINSLGKVIAFGGRVLKQKADIGKYKNTQETVLFNKKRNLFGINNLKEIKNQNGLDYVIMVEGYMDAISLYQAGFKNVVASMGTSLTLEQAKLLKRYVSKVIVSYDGDGAGQKATVRSLDIFAGEGFDIRVISLPEGLDPDDVIKKYGADKYQQLIDGAIPLIDFKLKIIADGKDMNDISDKRKYVAESLAFLRTVKDAYVREELLKQVRNVSGISYEALKRDLENGTDTVTKVETVPEISIKTDAGDGITRAERFILASLIYNKKYAENYGFDLYFTNETREKISDELAFGSVDPSELLKAVGDEGTEELNAVLTAGEKIFGTQAEEKYYKDCVLTVKRSNLENEIKELNKLYEAEIDLAKRQAIADMILTKTIKLTEA